jgi:hypothetical protein
MPNEGEEEFDVAAYILMKLVDEIMDFKNSITDNEDSIEKMAAVYALYIACINIPDDADYPFRDDLANTARKDLSELHNSFPEFGENCLDIIAKYRITEGELLRKILKVIDSMRG